MSTNFTLKRFGQQGDVLIKKVNINLDTRDDLKEIDVLVLAEGEATGHSHKAFPIKPDEKIVTFYQTNIMYFAAPPGGAVIRHEEHNTINVPEGIYKVEIVQAYDHFEEETRAVRD